MRDDYDFTDSVINYVPPEGAQPAQNVSNYTTSENDEAGSLMPWN
ncbi:hypothetical protein [Pseudoxanthomonas sp. UTMC 1351]